MIEFPSPPSHAVILWDAYRTRRFSILLIALLALLAGSSLLLQAGLSAGLFDGLMSLLLLAAILSLCIDRRQRLFATLLGIPAIVLTLGGHALLGDIRGWALFLAHMCQICFLFAAAGLVVRSLFTADELSFDSVLGAVCGYLFLGLGWAVGYSMIERFRPGSFEVSPSLATSAAPYLDPQVLTYYSFVTLTTVGYGDINPVSPAARTLAWLEAIAGQFYLAVIVAG